MLLTNYLKGYADTSPQAYIYYWTYLLGSVAKSLFIFADYTYLPESHFKNHFLRIGDFTRFRMSYQALHSDLYVQSYGCLKLGEPDEAVLMLINYIRIAGTADRSGDL